MGGAVVGHRYLYKLYRTHMPTCRYYPPTYASPNTGSRQLNPSAPTGSGNPGPGHYKIFVNGQDITVGPANEGGGDIECLRTGLNNDQIDIRVVAARDMQDAYPPQVVRVALVYADTGMQYLFDPTQNQSQHIGGDAQVAKSGDTYKRPT